MKAPGFPGRFNAAGTVEGEHSDVPWMQQVLAAPTPYHGLSGEGRRLALEDPAHDPRDFLWLLDVAYWPALDEPLRSTVLPPALRDVELRPASPPEPAYAVDENGDLIPVPGVLVD